MGIFVADRLDLERQALPVGSRSVPVTDLEQHAQELGDLGDVVDLSRIAEPKMLVAVGRGVGIVPQLSLKSLISETLTAFVRYLSVP